LDPITALGAITIVVLSVTTHEAAHGFVADRLGDPTARELGRLTLNPIPHIDLIFTILLPAFLIFSGSPVIFGGAKPVPVNLTRLRRPRRDWALVGAAGPGSNLVIATSLCLLLSLLRHGGVLGPASAGTEVLAIGVFVNILLAVFNLIPIPPLDGSRVLQYFLTDAQLGAYRRFERYGLFVILGLLFFVPGAMTLVADGVFAVTGLFGAVFGVSAELASVLGGPPGPGS